MSIKQQLHQAIDSLPDSLTLEEAVDRLYRAFKVKHPDLPGSELEPLPVLDCSVPDGWKDGIYDRP